MKEVWDTEIERGKNFRKQNCHPKMDSDKEREVNCNWRTNWRTLNTLTGTGSAEWWRQKMNWGVLVISCCVTHCHNLISLKQYRLAISQFPRVGIWTQADWVFCPVSHQTAFRCQPGLEPHSELSSSSKLSAYK